MAVGSGSPCFIQKNAYKGKDGHPDLWGFGDGKKSGFKDVS